MLPTYLISLLDEFVKFITFYIFVPISLNHIMFAHYLRDSKIEYLKNSIDFNRKDRAKRYHK